MTYPNWYGLVLLGLAAFRTWKLIAEDTILDRPRNASLMLAYKIAGPKGKDYWQTLIECPWCAGFWISLAWWGAFELWPNGSLVAAVPLALSAIVGLLAWFSTD
jgi:hypothetical protein